MKEPEKGKEPSEDHKRRYKILLSLLKEVVRTKLDNKAYGDFGIQIFFKEGEIELVDVKDHTTIK